MSERGQRGAGRGARRRVTGETRARGRLRGGGATRSTASSRAARRGSRAGGSRRARDERKVAVGGARTHRVIREDALVERARAVDVRAGARGRSLARPKLLVEVQRGGLEAHSPRRRQPARAAVDARVDVAPKLPQLVRCRISRIESEARLEAGVAMRKRRGAFSRQENKAAGSPRAPQLSAPERRVARRRADAVSSGVSPVSGARRRRAFAARATWTSTARWRISRRAPRGSCP
jgi:hypothetical protein